MFNSLVNSLIAEGIAIQVAGGISAIALEGKSLEGREGAAYAQRIYPSLTAWMRDVFNAYDNAYLTKTQMLQVFRVVKEDRIERVERFRKSYILQQTTQVAEVVVDELALVKAELAAVKADRKSVVEELETVKRDNRDLTQKLGAYQALIEGLKSRTIVVGNVITKVLVSSKVGV